MNLKVPLISIVIPMYGVETYLKECLDSVMRQTYKNLEIILVDDGSPDRCGEIAEMYASKDERFIVIHKINGGLSDTRNVGIAAATGDYIFFLDSDDIIEENAIESLYYICHDGNADIAISGLYNFIGAENVNQKRDEGNKTNDSDGVKADIPVYKDQIEYMNSKETMKKILLPQGIGYEAPGKLYRRLLWEGIQFPVGNLYEDYSTTYKVILKAERIGILLEPIYGYRVRAGSIMQSNIKEKNLSLIDISESVTKEISQKVPELAVYAKYLQVRTNLKLMEGILKAGRDSFLEAQKRIVMLVNKEGRQLLEAGYVRKKDKVKIISLMVNKNLFMLVYWFGEKVNMKKIKRGKN